MGRVIVSCIGMSIDGYAAGPRQDLDNPLGVGGRALMDWAFGTRTFQAMFGQSGGSTGIDDRYAARSFDDMGAWILGRNMFGPVRGPWPDDEWKGWWGTNPPYHVPTFVLTHHARAALEMEGGTTFHFVTDGIESALAQARAAAQDRNVRIGGGPATIRQYLSAGLVDEIHIAISPCLLGAGEPLLAGLNLPALGYRCSEREATAAATHVVLTRA